MSRTARPDCLAHRAPPGCSTALAMRCVKFNCHIHKLVADTCTKALVRTRVEPKTFFANERTFLQWCVAAVLPCSPGPTLRQSLHLL